MGISESILEDRSNLIRLVHLATVDN